MKNVWCLFDKNSLHISNFLLWWCCEFVWKLNIKMNIFWRIFNNILNMIIAVTMEWKWQIVGHLYYVVEVFEEHECEKWEFYAVIVPWIFGVMVDIEFMIWNWNLSENYIWKEVNMKIGVSQKEIRVLVKVFWYRRSRMRWQNLMVHLWTV